MNLAEISERLRSSVLGTELGEAEAAALAERMGSVSLVDGEPLVADGESRSTLFVLADGRLCVCKSVGGTEEVLYRLRPGECAGTRAFIDGSPRKAALRSEGASRVLTLEPDAFEGLVETHPRLVYKVMRALFRTTHTNLMRVNLERHELENYMLKTGGRY